MEEQQSSGRKPSTSLLALVAVLAVIGITISVLGQWVAAQRHKAIQISCLNNLKCIGTQFGVYEADWDDHLPPLYSKAQHIQEGRSWPKILTLRTHHDHAFRQPEGGGGMVYSFNTRLAGVYEGDIYKTSQTIQVFDSVNDSTANNNLHGSLVWRPKAGQLPPVGALIAWNNDSIAFSRRMPEWARPRHGIITNVCFVDGHLCPMEGWDPQFTMSLK